VPGHTATNLRRLVFFHHASAREAARTLGVNEHAVSAWINGKREPGGQALMAIDRTYGISPRELDLDEVAFAQRLADPDRMEYARKTLAPKPRDVKRAAK
jgi:transcriptional regulator with XRE-family HTH domain